MGRVVASSDVERRGLRLLVRLLHDAGGELDQQAVVGWIAEATSTIRSSDLIAPSLHEELDDMEPVTDSGGWKAAAVQQLVTLTGRLQEIGDLEIRLRGGRAFVSYVREDSATVDRLVSDLRTFGIDVWLDRDDMAEATGLEWQDVVRSEIETGRCFIGCFSEAWTQREHTYADEEVAIAVDHLRSRPDSGRWFFPVELEPDSLPDVLIDAERRVSDFQSTRLYDDWYGGIIELADAILPPSGKVRSLRDPLFDKDPKVREEAAYDVANLGDQRHLIPLLRVMEQQFALLDQDPDQGGSLDGPIEKVLYQGLRALGVLGRRDEWCGERALPVFVEMIDRGLYEYKVEEVMARQRSRRVRQFLRAYQTAGPCRFSELLGGEDPRSVDLDLLQERAEERGKLAERLGLK